jgi:hypothetical protein
MTTSVNINRQTVLSAVREVDFEDFTSGVAKPIIYLRPGTQILRGFVEVTEVWNAAGAVAATIGDTEGTDDVDRYLASTSVKALGVTNFTSAAFAATPISAVIDTAEALTMTVTTASGTNATGKARVYIEFVEENRGTEFNTYRG